MEYLSLILGIFALVSLLGTVAASFYGVRQKTIIATLRESNDAYKERNDMLDKQLEKLIIDHKSQIDELAGRIRNLEAIKTPPIQPLMKLIEANELSNQRRHDELMAALPAKRKKS